MDYAEDIFREFTREVAQTLLSQPLQNLEEQKEFISERVKRMKNKTQIMFVILDKNSEFLGVCNLHGIHKKVIVPGIWLKISAQSQAFGSEAMAGMTNWAKIHLNFEILEYGSYQENIASRKIAEKLGGQFVQNKKLTRVDGKIVDVVEYQIKNPNYQPSNSRVQALVIKNGVDKFSRSDLDKIQELGRSFGLPGIAYIQFEKNSPREGWQSQTDGVFSNTQNNINTSPAKAGTPQEENLTQNTFQAVLPQETVVPKLQAKSPILKFFGDEEMQKIKQQEIMDFLNIQAGDLVLFVAHADKDLIHKAQNAIRKHVATKLDLLDQNSLKFVWIYDFPFFEEVETQHAPSLSAHPSQEGTIQIDFAHNPFGIFQNWTGLSHLETLTAAKEQNRLLELRAVQYDIACNGYEVLSGGRRNNIPECLMEGFKLVGYSEEEVKEKFGHMMEAYSYGAPTHAGFAWGIDRLFMVLTEEDNIREIIAFPKNGSGMDLMMNSPSSVRASQLKELSIKNLE